MEEQERLLVERARADPAAFSTLYRTYVDRIYNYVYQRTGSHADAEDLTARTFLKAFVHLQTYVFRGVPFSAWLYRIAHNAVVNWYRDQHRHRVVSLDALIVSAREGDQLEDWTQAHEEQRALQSALRRLPQERQELLILKFSDDLTNAEIGQIMGRTEGAIKSLYHRTLLELREQLREPGTD
jgi:RNA polymerase sigma-70 factor (ECF subfamily)